MRREARARHAGRVALLVRTVALVLLATIAADLVGDTSCDLPDPEARAPVVAVGAQSGEAGDDPCASFCVPDCFCCSRSVGATSAVAPPRPALLSAVPADESEHRTPGIRPVVDHPPLARA